MSASRDREDVGWTVNGPSPFRAKRAKSQVKNTLIDLPKSPYAQREHSNGCAARISDPAAAPRGAREAVCGPVTNMMIKSVATWTAACPGTSLGYAGPSPLSLVLGGEPARFGGAAPVAQRVQANGRWLADGMRPRDLRNEQQAIQDEQGRSVFEHLVGTGPIAPATARKGATSTKGGVSGPYPWRQPV